MQDLFIKVYSSIRNKNKILSKLKFYGILRMLVEATANIILPVYFKLYDKRATILSSKGTTNKDPKIIVSLTSFPARIKNVNLVIETILRQTAKPDKIILYLSKNQFDSLDILPEKLLYLQSQGLTIEIVEGDIRSHKKYYYVINEYPEDILITIDDDIFYPTNMIESLLEAHKEFPQDIIARYGRGITYNDKNIINPYNEWTQHYYNNIPDTTAFFGSGGGTLFPPKSLHPIVGDKELFMKICPTADDVWLNIAVRFNNLKIRILEVNKDAFLLSVLNLKNRTLSKQNVGNNLNDKQILNVRNYYLRNYGVDPLERDDNV